eukprot:jgi/Mesen1/7034/ME000366S06234
MADRSKSRYSALPREDDPQSEGRASSQSQGPAVGGRSVSRRIAAQGRAALNQATDLRYSYEPKVQIPWKAILLALFLLCLGVLFLVVAYLMLTGHMGGDSSQGWGFFTLGCLIFLPGFYETRIAYYSWRGMIGYSYNNIPQY